MQPQQRHKAYQQASHTVAKTRQVVMLYDGMIRFMSQAKEALESGNIEQRYLKLTRVSEILAGLQSCLDFSAGEDTARLLYSFYASIERRVFNLHHEPNLEVCSQIIAELKDMRDAWDTIDRGKEAPTPVTEQAVTLDPITFSA